MRLNFEENLRKINSEINIGENKNEPEELFYLNPQAMEGKTGLEKIKIIQEKKKEAMAWLKNELAGLDGRAKKEKKEDEKKIFFLKGKYYFDESGTCGSEISLGEIMTDGDWGMKYYLDPESMPRSVQKKYLVETAKRKLYEYLDKQIAIDEIEYEGGNDWKKRLTYKKIMDQREAGKEQEIGGLIAEKMVENFLRKISYDHDVQFEIIKADVYQDVEQKVDFIIRRKSRLKGVGVEEVEKADNIGVQFTTNFDPEVLRKKRKQIRWAERHLKEEDNIEGLILVRLPLENTRGLYEKWKKDKKAGGPDKLWPDDLRERIFKQTMKGILSEEEISSSWEKIKG